MFKLLGLLLLGITIFFVFCRNTLKEYYTCIFLNQLIEIIKTMKLSIKIEKTYPEIFSDFDVNSYSCFRDFNFEKRDEFLKKLKSTYLIKEEISQKTSKFFSNIGRKNKEMELEYLEQNIIYFKHQQEKIQSLYNKNRKSNYIAGRSLGIIVFIIMI